MKISKPIFFFISLLVLVGLACSSLGTTQPGNAPTAVQPAQQEATQEPASSPTSEPPAATSTPAASPTPEAQQFFTDEFDTDSNWSYFVVDGTTSKVTNQTNPKMSVAAESSMLTFDLKDEGLWVYDIYKAFEYEDVRLDARVSNRGVNNNNVSLICRYSDSGWYEFNIANNGLYWILVASVNSSKSVGYDLIYNGGSNKIKSGKETNEYTAICKGNELSLFINGEEARTVTDSKYGLKSGQIGVSVSSFGNLPVVVDFDWIKISEP